MVHDETEHAAKESGEASLSQTKEEETRKLEQHTSKTKEAKRIIRKP